MAMEREAGLVAESFGEDFEEEEDGRLPSVGVMERRFSCLSLW